MEFFDYSDWIAEGRRLAFAKGSPDVDTEYLFLEVHDNQTVDIIYGVELKTTEFVHKVASMSIGMFSTRFFSMLAVEGQ